MNRVLVLLSLALTGLVLVLAGCVQEVEREPTNSATVAPATPEPTATSIPAPRPTATPVPTSTIPPTPRPTAGPTPPPAETPAPTPKLPPTVTPSPTEGPNPRLVLDVRAPENGSTVSGNAVVVHGITTPGASVSIKGLAALVGDDGGFQEAVTLTPGINDIQVVATDSKGNRESKSLRVTSLALPPQPFLLFVTEPEDQSIVSESSIRLSGRTGPEAITSINGVSVPVDELGFFSTILTLEPGPNIIDVVATNNDGRVLSTVIAVIYRPKTANAAS